MIRYKSRSAKETLHFEFELSNVDDPGFACYKDDQKLLVRWGKSMLWYVCYSAFHQYLLGYLSDCSCLISIFWARLGFMPCSSWWFISEDKRRRQTGKWKQVPSGLILNGLRT